MRECFNYLRLPGFFKYRSKFHIKGVCVLTFFILFFTGILVIILFLKLFNSYAKKSCSKFVKILRYILNTTFILFIISFIFIEVLIIRESHNDSYSIHRVGGSYASIPIAASNLDYIIIPGDGLEGDKLSERVKDRVDMGLYFLSLWVRNNECKMILSGGKGKNEYISEAEAMGKHLLSCGFINDRLLYEKNSVSIIESLMFSRDIIKQDSGKDKPYIMIVCSDYHLYRVGMVANKLGFNFRTLAIESDFSTKVNYFIREYFALIKDWVLLNLN